jgi:hypothetical protein
MFPSPPPALADPGQFRRAATRLRWFNALAPEFRRAHPVGPHLPQECIAIFSHSFSSDQYDTMYHVPAYQRWLESQDMRTAYAYHRKFLQLLRYGRPNRRLVLKAPAHVASIDALFATYPDAVVVQTHRDPLEIMPSVASMTAILRTTFSQVVDLEYIGKDIVSFWARALERFLLTRKRVGEEAFIDVQYLDLKREPLAVVRFLYRQLGCQLSGKAEARMTRFLRSYAYGKNGRHSYSAAAFGMEAPDIEERFQEYRSLFVSPQKRSCC